MIDLDPSSFNPVVMDPAKVVVVAFYAKWCKQDKMDNLMSQLQVDLATEYSVVLARVDADRFKDIFAHFDPSTLPSILIFPQNDKKGIEYTGPRNEPALLETILKYVHGDSYRVSPSRFAKKGPKPADFTGAPPPVPAPPRPDDYPQHPFEWYIPHPPPPSSPNVAAMMSQPFFFDPSQMPPPEAPLPDLLPVNPSFGGTRTFPASHTTTQAFPQIQSYPQAFPQGSTQLGPSAAFMPSGPSFGGTRTFPASYSTTPGISQMQSYPQSFPQASTQMGPSAPFMSSGTVPFGTYNQPIY